MVRAKGVEPSLPREPDPKSGASTNSATRAPRPAALGPRWRHTAQSQAAWSTQNHAWPGAWAGLLQFAAGRLSDGAQFVHQCGKAFEVDLLCRVTDRLGRVGVYFDEECIGAHGDCAPAHGAHQ